MLFCVGGDSRGVFSSEIMVWVCGCGGLLMSIVSKHAVLKIQQ